MSAGAGGSGPRAHDRGRTSDPRATDTIARELLGHVDDLLDRSSPATSGLWPRAAALLTRQALEVALRSFWSAKAPGVESCPMRAQLLFSGGTSATRRWDAARIRPGAP